MATSIRDRLIEEGRRVFEAPRGVYPFTGDAAADELLNDLDRYPHAFVMACIADRQVKAERTWLIPFRLKQSLGTFAFARLKTLTADEMVDLMGGLHRFAPTIGRDIHHSLGVIAGKYHGDAGQIWAGTPSSADVVYRFLELRGVGVKIATMAANILARHLKVPFSDYYSIDISPDRHVRRVFARLGLTRQEAPNEELIYRARGLWPEFPGLLDIAAFEIGRAWCKAERPICSKCLMRDVCPSAGTTVGRMERSAIRDSYAS